VWGETLESCHDDLDLQSLLPNLSLGGAGRILPKMLLPKKKKKKKKIVRFLMMTS
jgi:hypothetical protein